MNYRITHTTRYTYRAAVPICYNLARLTPRSTEVQRLLSGKWEFEPVPAAITGRRSDYFGNEVTYFTVDQLHQRLDTTVRSEVQLFPRAGLRVENTPAWEAARERVHRDRGRAGLDAYQFTFDSPHVVRSDTLRDYAAPSFPPGRPLLDALLDLTRRIHADFQYDPAATTVSTPLHEVLRNRRGVCQDYAHLQIGCLRSLGLPARYVSGYIHSPANGADGALVGAQASHAWVSCYCPGLGWIDLDPTNNMVPALEHITLALGRDYDDISPLRGIVLGGGEHTVEVTVRVERVE